MKLFAHSRHSYGEPGKRGFMEWADNQARDVDDELGRMLLASHPAKFCDVTDEVDVSEHVCEKTLQNIDREQYEREQLVPDNIAQIPGTGRVSKQRLELRRQTYARSRVARVNRANASRSA